MKSLKLIVILMTVCMTVSALIGTAHAEEIWFENRSSNYEKEQQWLLDNIQSINTSSGEVKGSKSWISKYLTANPDKAATINGIEAELGTWSSGNNIGIIYLKDGKDMDDLISKIQSAINGENITGKVNDIVTAIDGTADTEGAVLAITGLLPLVRIGIGLMVVLITVGMTIFSALDIAYIAFPILRNKCDDRLAEGRGPGVKMQANGEMRLTWISDDAQYAIKEGTIESGRSPWGIYFKRRIVSYIMLAIILFILMTGNINIITNVALNIVSGIMDVLSALA